MKRREIPPTFSGVTISSHLSAALADAGRESQFEETCSIRHRPTCLKKSHVFSLNARFYPLSDNLSPPSPFSLSLSCPVALSFHVLATRSLASLFHAARDVAFPDLFRLYGSFKTEIPLDCVKVSAMRLDIQQNRSAGIFRLSIV